MRQTISAALDGLALFWGLAIGPFCWLLRDGLGPGSVDSHGAHAVARFLLTFYWGPVFVALMALRLLVRQRGAGRRASADVA
ncbi:MAG: hypothetical protein JWN86_3033 [Planctomycetota bacterium]|nr:hypothetical protein [Planctomycetota bacterium]